MSTTSFADRAWLAYHSLPRTKRGKPPSYRSLEDAAGLSNGTISRVMLGEREDHSYETKTAIARVLAVSTEWLAEGRGEAPTPTGAVPPRLPYLVEEGAPESPRPTSALDEARAFLDEVVRQSPDASPLELLAAAQMIAIRRKLT
jgi:transcriptional regulator with XRE-family HTH domain